MFITEHNNNFQDLDSKSQFLRYAFALDSIASAVRTRNKKYPLYIKDLKDSEKESFKKYLLNYTLTLWDDRTSISKEEMLKEIQRFETYCTKEYGSILDNGKMRLGIAQKLITLMAKYLWVSGQLKTPPPLIPYDGIIKNLLNNKELKDWTVLDDMEGYQTILRAIDKISNDKPAEWELENWNKAVLS